MVTGWLTEIVVGEGSIVSVGVGVSEGGGKVGEASGVGDDSRVEALACGTTVGLSMDWGVTRLQPNRKMLTTAKIKMLRFIFAYVLTILT
jgi:hypothetical protein